MPSPFILLGIVLLSTFTSSFSSRSSSISNLSPDDVTEEGSEEIHHFPNIMQRELKLWKEISSEPRKQLRETIYYSSEVYSMSEEELYLGKRQIRKHMEDLIRAKSSSDGKMVEMYGTVETEEGIIMEEEKQNTTCNVGQWLCNDTVQCIPYDGVCNDTADCRDMSDEAVELCGCDIGWFKCKTKCIPESKLCDNYPHCPDGEDETKETCGGVNNYCESRYKDYFRCDYGGCLKNRNHCDFIVDCLDGSDERNCSRPECPKSFFECSNKECVTEGKICDGIYDCVDGSDEAADFCRPENFKQCKTGKRIHVNFWCDGYINCPFDHADENDCNSQGCASGDFRCNPDGGRCLHRRFQCDGFCDCLDCQDENTCSLKKLNRSSGIPDCEKKKSVGCNMHKWHMEKYRCLHKEYICDGANFCGMKSSDYSMCLNATSDSCENMKENDSRDLFFCNDGPYGRCIDKARRVCNGKRDCLNGEDEENCNFSPCDPGEWKCDGGPCVHESARCNLIYECKDRSDEMDCEGYKCAPNMKSCFSGQCIKKEYWCDHIKDCPDGSDEDEDNCHKKYNEECNDSGGVFRCLGPNRQCIPRRDVCMALPGRKGCVDKSHLYQNCSSLVNCSALGLEQCRHGQCIMGTQICDGKLDCPDTYDDEDEDHCPYDCSQEEAKCSCMKGFGDCSGRNLEVFPFIVYRISKLDLSNNNLGSDMENVGRYVNVIHLILSNNNITELQPLAFSHLTQLNSLDLRNNKLTKLTEEVFMGLSKLNILHLDGNKLQVIGPRAFLGLVSLQQLNLSHQRISVIEPEAFLGLDKLLTLLLMDNQLRDLPSDVFNDMPNLQKLEIDKWSYCCLVPNVTDCSGSPPREPFSSCDDLLSNQVLRVFVWVVGTMALLGNAFAMYFQINYSLNKKVRSFLLRNLAMGDLLMGVYLLLVAFVDQWYRSNYAIMEEDWRNSVLCKVAGFLSTLSSELSIFTLAVMTTEMHFTIVKGLRFRSISCLTMLESGRSIYLLMTGVWAVAILLAALPLFGFQYFYNFYGRSGVCLALHITNDRPSGWEYSVFVFLVLNFVLFGIIALNYFLLYKTVRNHKVRMRRTNSDSNWNEMKMLALRVFLVVATDALCWLPIIFLGILSISGVDIPPSVFSWTAVFILPINSVINPILYTFTSRTMTNAMYSLRNSICHRRQLYRNSSGSTGMTFVTRNRETTRREIQSTTPRTVIARYNYNSSPPVTHCIQLHQ